MLGAYMVDRHQFTLGSVQAAMFTPDHSAFVSGRVVASVMRKFADLFDGEIQVLPIPAHFPPQVPRVTLQSADGAWRLNAGPARIDCAWNGARPLALHEVAPRCSEVLTHYVSERQVRVGRLSLLVGRACPNADPAKTLIQRFCNEESQRQPFNRSASFEIHNHKVYTPGNGVDYPINSFVRCQCGLLSPDRTRAISVTQDLNTLAEEVQQRQFDADKIARFFSVVRNEAETILEKYFPERTLA